MIRFWHNTLYPEPLFPKFSKNRLVHMEIRKEVFHRLGLPEYDIRERRSITTSHWGGTVENAVFRIANQLQQKAAQVADPLGDKAASELHNQMVKLAEMAKDKAKREEVPTGVAGGCVSSVSSDGSPSYPGESFTSFMDSCMETIRMQNRPGELHILSIKVVLGGSARKRLVNFGCPIWLLRDSASIVSV